MNCHALPPATVAAERAIAAWRFPAANRLTDDVWDTGASNGEIVAAIRFNPFRWALVH